MVPYNDQTHHLADAGFLARMPDQAVLVNVASPVFTAHPTEMRRASIVEREYEITQLLQAFEKSSAGAERNAIRDDLYREVALLWSTMEYLVVPYVAKVLPDVALVGVPGD